MVVTLLTLIWLFGLVYAVNRLLKIDPAYAPLFSISLAGILLFVFGILDFLNPGAGLILFSGFILFGIGVVDYWKDPQAIRPLLFDRRLWILGAMIPASYLLTMGMKFTVDDDYVYWGIMGKYLSSFHHLPDSDTTIVSRHLAYTPGTSLIHYLFYQLAGKYSPAISYFAQNIVLISTLFVLSAGQSLKKGLFLIFLSVVLLMLFSGSVFTKLQVDYLLSIYFFGVIWIILREKPSAKTAMIILPPVCFLFLIKEIGFVMALVLVTIFLTDLVFHRKTDLAGKMKALGWILFTVFLLAVLKQTWANHCIEMGFPQFNNAMSPESLKQAMDIFSNPDARKGAILVLKELLFGESDRLNLPYIFWYLFLSLLFVKIRSRVNGELSDRFVRTVSVLLFALSLYVVMLYFLQIIVFHVGQVNDHTIGFVRYLNILFSPMVFLFVLIFANERVPSERLPNKAVLAVGITVCLMLVFSRVENSIRREEHYVEAGIIAEKIQAALDENTVHRIGIVPGVKDNHLWIRMLYYLLPNRVNHGRFPAENQSDFLAGLKQYHYLLFYQPEQEIIDWAAGLVDKPIGKQGFYRVYSDSCIKKQPLNPPTDPGDGHPVCLKKIF